MNVYGDLSLPGLEEENWQDAEETYVEMSGGLVDGLKNMNNLKETTEQSPTIISTLSQGGYIEINTLKERSEEAGTSHNKKISQKKESSTSKAKMCATVHLVIILTALLSVATSVATHMIFMHIIHSEDRNGPPQPSLCNTTTFNCTAEIASRCSLESTNDTYTCKTEAVLIEDSCDMTTLGIQCMQINGYDFSMVTALVFEEKSNKAQCICSIMKSSDNNSTLSCGIWVNKCSPNN